MGRGRRLLAIAACLAFSGAIGPANAQTLQTLRISTIPFDAGSEAFYAKDLGFFAKQGLDATVNPVGNGPAIAAAVASGAIDIGFSNALSVETAYKKGLPFVFIAAAAVYSSAAPASVLMVPKDAPFKVAKDLNGKTIAVNGLKNIAVRAKFGETLSANALQPTIDLAARYKLLETFPATDLIYVAK